MVRLCMCCVRHVLENGVAEGALCVFVDLSVCDNGSCNVGAVTIVTIVKMHVLMFIISQKVSRLFLQVRACEGAVGRERFMESPQCLEDIPGAQITQDLCIPPVHFVSQYLIALAREMRIYTVFVASDVAGEKHGLQQLLGRKVCVCVYLWVGLYGVHGWSMKRERSMGY